MLNNKSILITGGTGSFGKKFIEIVLKKYSKIKRLVIFSRDELKQFQMQQLYPENKYPNLRFFIGDIRDKDRLKFALDDIDIIIHAAALKQVPTAEYNPFEFIKSNVIGTQNIIEAALDHKVKHVISLSTDKASSPINLYGATKLCSDKLIISANNIKGKRKTKFAVVRYGNVMGSRGSVLPLFRKIKDKGKLPLTNIEMTRFNISLEQAVQLVETALAKCEGGEIFVPKLKSFFIKDLIEAISGKKNFFKLVGIRPGEKIHEELINPSDSRYTVKFKKNYVILPNQTEKQIKKYCIKKKCELVPKNFSYDSGSNKDFLNIREIKEIIKRC